MSTSEPRSPGDLLDHRLLDRLSGYPQERFQSEVFRATSQSADPLAFSTSGGCWAAPAHANVSIPVLYTSLEKHGAIAEVVSYLALLTPPPAKPLVVHKLAVTARRTLRLLRADLADVGVDLARYEERTYARRSQGQLSRTQEIGSALNFLGFDGLLVPSARWPCENLILFHDNHGLDERLEVVASEQVDWQTWARERNML